MSLDFSPDVDIYKYNKNISGKMSIFYLCGVLPRREITVTGIFLYLYYPRMRILMLIRSTWGLYFSFRNFFTYGMVTLTCFFTAIPNSVYCDTV